MTPAVAEKYPDYLIQWRLSLWASIRHKELIIWTFTGFYATAIGIILGAGGKYVTPLVQFCAVVALSFLGVHVVLDAVSWNARNLFTISRIENEYIAKRAGELIPASYLRPDFRVATIQKAQLLFISGVPCVSYLRYAWQFRGTTWTSEIWPSMLEFLVASLVSALFSVVTRWIAKQQRKSYFDFRAKFRQEVGSTVTDDAARHAETEDPTWVISATCLSLTFLIFDLAIFGQLRPSKVQYLASALLLLAVVAHCALAGYRWVVPAKTSSGNAGRQICLESRWIRIIGASLSQSPRERLLSMDCTNWFLAASSVTLLGARLIIDHLLPVAPGIKWLLALPWFS